MGAEIDLRGSGPIIIPRRITDHRINLTQYNLAEFMEGDLDTMIDTLVQENAAKQMAQLDD
ncbi:MAG: hypothetical protein Ct9H90mP13_00090 [Pseudomonadota bacterium]|nr:MAG: hypothetical protein Ct9H90mP13_00090 [Pseudomonadota bacterium]